MNTATAAMTLPIPDEHFFGTIGLTRDQASALTSMFELLQPRFRFSWKHVPHDRAQVVFFPLPLEEPVRARLHHDQIPVVLCTESHHAAKTGHELEFPLRVSPVLDLIQSIENQYGGRTRDIFRAPVSEGPELLGLLRQWLHGRPADAWHVTRLPSGESMWLHPMHLTLACIPNHLGRVEQSMRGWSMPLPTNDVPPPGCVHLHLLPLALKLAEAPMAPRPDWMFEDHTEVRLASWPDLGLLEGAHWQVQATSLMSTAYLSMPDIAHRVGRSLHDVAAFVSACDVFGHVLHRAPVTKLVDHRAAGTRHTERTVLTQEPEVREEGGFFGLLRSIRNRLQGKPA